MDETWLKPELSPTESRMSTFSGALVTHEKEMIEAALVLSQGRISGPGGAAEKLDLPARTLDSKI
ncbi:hypothetical protein, partial [Klebsiella pneumoniae]|uniref:hypothetical protein n=1 Tax=Klebsiella pneumoniae TaxID=573 RepID=UPI0030135EC4